MAYIVDVKGRPYRISEYRVDHVQNRNNATLLKKGDYIPIYEWAKSEWNSIAEDVADYFWSTNDNKWYGGRVMFLSDVIDNYIYAIIFHWWGTGSSPSLADRQAMTNYPNFAVSIVKDRYNSNYDYSHFTVNRHASDYNSDTNVKTWLPYFFQSTAEYAFVNPTSSSGMFVNKNWIDGAGGQAVSFKTLLMPSFYYVTLGGEPFNEFYGLQQLICDLGGDGGLFPVIYRDYSWLTVGESVDFQQYINESTIAQYNLTTGIIASNVGIGDIDLTIFTSGYEPPEDKDYPFELDYNEGGGGTGDYRDASDNVPVDGVPTVSAISSGFVKAYQLTNQNMLDLHSFLNSSSFLDNVKKLISDPIDYIISVMLAPYSPTTGNAVNISVGGVNTEVSALPIASGYVNLSCGSITLNEFWGKYLDYNPYTKVQIFLPFIGIKPLDIDDVMASTVSLSYRIDVLTGACVATVHVNNARGTNGAVYYFNGNCHTHVPVSGKNYFDTLANVFKAGSGLAGAISQSNPLGIASGIIDVVKSGREVIEHAGEIQGNHGQLANYTPFLIVSRPSQSLAYNFRHYKGFVSNVTKRLGDVTGYTEVAYLVQTDIHCTLDEFEEIEKLLKEGVYL